MKGMMADRLMTRHVLMMPDAGVATSADDGKGTEAKPDTVQQDGSGATPEEEGKGTSTPGWMGMLPDDLKQDSELAKYPTIGEYIKAMKASAAAESPKQPGEAKPVEYDDKFATKLGVIADPLGDVTASLKRQLGALGIPQSKAEAFVKALDEGYTKAFERYQKEGTAWRDAQLARRWGEQAKAKTNLANRAIQLVVGDDKDLADELARSGVTVNPAMWEAMARVGAMLGDDAMAFSKETGTAPRVDPFHPIHYPR